MIMRFHKCHLFGLIIAALLLAGVTGRPRSAAADTGLHRLYLPWMIVQTQTIFGLNATSLTPERGLDGLVASGAGWVRARTLPWRDVEPVEGGEYHWDAPSVQLAEQEMLTAGTYGLKLILLVRSSPTWATAPYKA